MCRRRLSAISAWPIAVLTIVSSCGRLPDHVSQTAPPETASSKLQALLTPELLGEELPYFEKLAGPAATVNETWRTYKVDACNLGIQVDGTKIVGVKLAADPKCPVDVSPLTNGLLRFLPTDRITFSNVAIVTGSVSVTGVDCDRLCGNHEDVSIYAYFQGSEASRELQVVAEADQFSPENRPAVKAWFADLTRRHGNAWMDARKYNCGSNALDLPSQLKPLRVSAIAIGRGMKMPASICDDAAEQPEAIDRPQTQDDQPHTDDIWYVLAFRLKQCVPISAITSADTPAELMHRFALAGRPQVAIKNKPDEFLFRSAEDPNDPGMAFLKGKANCELAMALTG